MPMWAAGFVLAVLGLAVVVYNYFSVRRWRVALAASGQTQQQVSEFTRLVRAHPADTLLIDRDAGKIVTIVVSRTFCWGADGYG